MDIFVIEKLMKFLNDKNIPTKTMTFYRKIMTSCAKNHNISMKCHNF